MAKPEWGIKRICQSCGIRYYDFNREQIVCPSCGAAFDPEAVLKSRRARVAVPAEPKKAAPVEDEDEDDEDLDEDETLDNDDDDDDDDADVDELGEDGDDPIAGPARTTALDGESEDDAISGDDDVDDDDGDDDTLMEDTDDLDDDDSDLKPKPVVED